MIASQLTLEKSQITFKPTEQKISSEDKKNQIIRQVTSNNNLSSCVRINFVTNNVYCTFWSITGKRTFRVRSAGMGQAKPSKRRLFFYGKLFMESFFRELQQWRKKYRKKGMFFFSLKTPKKFRKIILKYISRKMSVINFEYCKAFNGCKAKKKRRKKRLGFRYFK